MSRGLFVSGTETGVSRGLFVSGTETGVSRGLFVSGTETGVSRGLFVSGTDTGVGKTVVACALVRGLRARGLDVGAMKPAETGVGPDGPLDAIALREAAGGQDALEDVCPQRFALPAAPTVAAAAEGRVVDMHAVRDAYARLDARHDALVVEGAGGLLVPAAAGLSMIELAGELALPIVLVARAALGTINHTLLSAEAIESRGLELAGVVVSHCSGPTSDADLANLESLRESLGEQLLGEVPPLAPGEAPDPETLGLGRLFDRLTQAG